MSDVWGPAHRRMQDKSPKMLHQMLRSITPLLQKKCCTHALQHGCSIICGKSLFQNYFSFVNTMVPDAANIPPTPWATLIFAPSTWAGAMPRICRTLSCRAYMPYMPECM